MVVLLEKVRETSLGPVFEDDRRLDVCNLPKRREARYRDLAQVTRVLDDDMAQEVIGAVHDVYGYEEVIPTHQGRGAEHLLSQILITPGDVVPGNMYFTTTRYHQERAGGRFVDVIIDEAHDPESMYPFRGNIDLEKLAAVVEDVGAHRVAYVSFETNVNLAGGKPASMANIKTVYQFCESAGILVFLDASAILPHVPQDEFPDQALAAAIYADSGVRGMERGIVSAGRDPETGQNRHPKLELVCLTIPRRVYTQTHMDVVAESVIEVYEKADTITGLRFAYEPESLRFFQAEFAKIS